MALPLRLFADLIAYRAGSLAGRLAGSRAFTATASSQSLFQHLFIDSLNSFQHSFIPYSKIFYLFYIVLAKNARPSRESGGTKQGASQDRCPFGQCS